jgi:hypothetical protein
MCLFVLMMVICWVRMKMPQGVTEILDLVSKEIRLEVSRYPKMALP